MNPNFAIVNVLSHHFLYNFMLNISQLIIFVMDKLNLYILSIQIMMYSIILVFLFVYVI